MDHVAQRLSFGCKGHRSDQPSNRTLPGISCRTKTFLRSGPQCYRCPCPRFDLGPVCLSAARQSLRDAHSFPGLEVSWEQGLLPAETISGRGLWLYGCFHGLWWVIQLINVDYTIWCNGWISKLEVCTLRSKLGSLIRKVFANKRAKLRAERRSKKSGIWWELQWLAELKWNLYNCLKMAGCFVWSFQIRGVFHVFWWGFLSSWKLSSEWPNSCEGRGMYSLHHLRQKSMDNINYIYILVDVVVACCFQQIFIALFLTCNVIPCRVMITCDGHGHDDHDDDDHRHTSKNTASIMTTVSTITSTVNDNSGDNNTAHESHIWGAPIFIKLPTGLFELGRLSFASNCYQMSAACKIKIVLLCYVTLIAAAQCLQCLIYPAD